MKNHITNVFLGSLNHTLYMARLQDTMDQISPAWKQGIYAGDNLFTYGRNLSFLEDEKLMNSFGKHALEAREQAILWRISIVAWGARQGMRLEGDFVECACYKGTTARIVADYIDLKDNKDRHYYLYDLFEHDETMPHHSLPAHSQKLFDDVTARFSDLENVTVTQGRVPEILNDVAPEKIAFMHLDLNNADAEVGALELLFQRMVPGAVLILDDYGWLGYREQKLAEDPWLEQYGYRVLELPTGQGLLVK
jgi:O-methyltransferase